MNAADPAVAPPNQFALLTQRRFAPFFWTQFLGAANDNIFKFAFTMLVTYRVEVAWLPPSLAGLVIGAVFILPFLLFSATSGQIADKYDKARLAQLVKNLEIVIMVLVAAGLLLHLPALLLFCIFLLGLHSTLFGPVKYAYLPQHLDETEITGGNGMIEMGTFVAILLGNVTGGILIALPAGWWLDAAEAVAFTSLGLALLGRLAAQFIVRTPPTAPGLTVNWNPVSETWNNLKLAYGFAVVFRSLLGISWMWFFGAVFLMQFPSFAKEVLHGNEHVASLLLVVFSVGIGLGSILCEKLSGSHVEIGLVPLGAIGMTLFAADLWLAASSVGPASGLLSLGEFMARTPHWRVLADLFMLSLSAGLYSVPMYALIQTRSPASHRARIIAANNILNAIFMIAASLLVGQLLSAGMSIPQTFGLLALTNAVVSLYIFVVVPEYLLRFLVWVASHFVWRVHASGAQHLPLHGGAVVACSRVSAGQTLLLMAASPRPIRFVVDPALMSSPATRWLLRLSGAIASPARGADAAALQQAVRTLADGDLLGVFSACACAEAPHREASPQPFTWNNPDLSAILGHQPVPVIPMALAAAPTRRRVTWRRPAHLAIGAAITAQHATPAALQSAIQSLLAAVTQAKAKD